MQLSGRGVLLSVIASVLFAVIPAYVQQLQPLDGWQVFAQRVLWSIPGVLLILLLSGRQAVLLEAWQRLRREPLLCLALPLAAALMGVQWLLFVWAPLNGRMLDLSLGYFLLPLAMVLSGRLFYGERLRPLQQLAVACALVGVLHELWLTRAFSWVTLITALGYPPYFMLRRWMRLDALAGFVLEMLLLAPLAFWLVISFSPPGALAGNLPLWGWLAGLGLISAMAFGAMLASSRLLPLGLFGILGYLEPVLLFILAVTLLGEAFSSALLWTYAPIWLAVLLSTCDSLYLLHRQARKAKQGELQ